MLFTVSMYRQVYITALWMDINKVPTSDNSDGSYMSNVQYNIAKQTNRAELTSVITGDKII